MKRSFLIKSSILTSLYLSLNLFNTAVAAEGVTPLQPGATTGSHAGALPPPGLYLSYDVDYEWGTLKNGSGKTSGVDLKAKNVAMVLGLTWSTDYTLLGARYAAAIAQPYKIARSTGSTNGTQTNHGLMNTTLIPAILSWDLGYGFHLASGVAFVLRNGDYEYSDSNGSTNMAANNLANHYYTVQPNIALTYFYHDWAFTANNTVDFNSENTATNYRSGNTYYLDLTATKKIEAWTVGVIGNWTKQLADDKQNGQVVRPGYLNGREIMADGKRVEHVMMGPILAYDFGSFSVSSRFLTDIKARNDPKMSFFHVGVAIPL